jgi:hypothetical protein
VLANLLKDPDMMKAMVEQQAQLLKTEFAPLVKQLNLKPEQGDAFYKLLTDNVTNTMLQSLAMMEGAKDPDAASAAAKAEKNMQDQMRLLLGDSGYSQYQEFQATLSDRMMFEQMQASFTDDPLTGDQQQRLLQIMINERKNPANGMDPGTGKPAFPAATRAAQMEQALQIQDQINQQVYQQAAQFLTPNQLQTLANSQSNLLSLTRASLPMMQKMFGTESNAEPGGQ